MTNRFTALLVSAVAVLGVATLVQTPAIGLDRSTQATDSVDQPTPNIDGSSIEVTSGCGNPIPVASTVEDYKQGKVKMVEFNDTHISRGYNNHPGPRGKTRAKSKEKYVEFQSSIDSAVYLGQGYWLGAHNNFGYGKQLVVAKYGTTDRPSEGARPDAFWSADSEDDGIRNGKRLSIGKLTATVTYRGNFDGAYNWRVELNRFTPVSTKVAVTNGTGHLLAVASNYDDFMNRPALLHNKRDVYWNQGYENMRAPRSNDARSDATFTAGNDATVYLGRGYWLGAVSDNGKTTFTVAAFNRHDADPAIGEKAAEATSFSHPLYRWEPSGHVVEVDGLKLRLIFHGVSTTEASYSAEILAIKHQ